jgi:hypothetical protein
MPTSPTNSSAEAASSTPHPSAPPIDVASPEVQKAASALLDVRQRSLMRALAGQQEKWFPIAFNDWYCPALRRGYVGGMAPVFDIGLALMEPTAEFLDGGGHGGLLAWIRERPFIGELARRADNSIARGTQSREVRGLVTWTIVEPLLRSLSGVWDNSDAARRSSRELPMIERGPNNYRIYASPYVKRLIGTIDLHPSKASPTTPRDAAHLKRATGFAAPPFQALAMRLFSARIASALPQMAHKLDYELVDACLVGPVLASHEHEPPKRSPSDVATTQQTTKPGAIAGVTRIETRRPDDPLTDILPSELMVLHQSRKKGLAGVIYGRPLVVVHEREWDVIPKHRALVCYVVGANQDPSHGNALHRARELGWRQYRDTYIYAKRHVFDTLYDLADAQTLARQTSEVRVDAAVFAVPPLGEYAVVHQSALLEDLRRGATGDRGIDRLLELAAFAELAPNYFIRYASERDPRPVAATDRIANSLPTDIVQYLRKTLQQSRYRVIHLVLVGVTGSTRLLERLHRLLNYQTITQVRIHMIDVDVTRQDPDARLSTTFEPEWLYKEAGSLREALEIESEPGEAIPLATLRAQFVDAVFGKELKDGATQILRMRESLGGR